MKNLINKKGDKVVRVPDKKPTEIAGIKELLENGWSFCPNSKWRQFRDSKKAAPKSPKKKTTKKTTKKKAKKNGRQTSN